MARPRPETRCLIPYSLHPDGRSSWSIPRHNRSFGPNTIWKGIVGSSSFGIGRYANLTFLLIVGYNLSFFFTVLRSTEDKPQPKSTETSTSPTSPRETPANRSDQVTLPNLEVNDSPCDGGDQSLDESDAVHLAPYDLRLRADRHGRKRNRPNWGDLVKRYNHGIFIPLSVHPVDQLSTVVHRQSRTVYRTSQKAFDAAIQCGWCRGSCCVGKTP